MAKDRISLFFTVNATGTDKRKPLVIGKKLSSKGLPSEPVIVIIHYWSFLKKYCTCPSIFSYVYIYVVIAFENQLKVRLSIQATTALAETTAIADFRSLTVFSAIAVVACSHWRKFQGQRGFLCRASGQDATGFLRESPAWQDFAHSGGVQEDHAKQKRLLRPAGFSNLRQRRGRDNLSGGVPRHHVTIFQAGTHGEDHVPLQNLWHRWRWDVAALRTWGRDEGLPQRVRNAVAGERRSGLITHTQFYSVGSISRISVKNQGLRQFFWALSWDLPEALHNSTPTVSLSLWNSGSNVQATLRAFGGRRVSLQSPSRVSDQHEGVAGRRGKR